MGFSSIYSEDLQQEMECLNNLSDAEKKQGRKDLEEFRKKTSKMITKSGDTVKSLREVADYLDKVWMDCKIARASGSSAGIVGGILTITGGIATILTAGAATPLLLVGLSIGAAGAATNFGTSIAESIIKSSEIEKAEKDLKETTECIREVRQIVQKWRNWKERANLLYIFTLAIELLEFSDPIRKILQQIFSSAIYIPAHIVEVAGKMAGDIGLAGAQGAGTAGAQVAKEVGAQGAGDVAKSGARAGSKAGAKLAGGLIIGVSAVFVVWDAIDLGFTIKDIVKNKGSDAAKFLREKANELEEGYLEQ